MLRNKVPCSCQLCRGELVSQYTRRKHSLYRAKTGTSNELPVLPAPVQFASQLQSVVSRWGCLRLCTHLTTYTYQTLTQVVHQNKHAQSTQLPSLQRQARLGQALLLRTCTCTSLIMQVSSPCVDEVSEPDGYPEVGPCCDPAHEREDSPEAGLCCDPDPELDGSPVKKQKKYLYHLPNTDASLNNPLYNGASLTLEQALVNHFTWFTEHPGISKQALSDILYMQHHTILPSDNILPDSYTEAMSIIKPYLVTPVVYDVCPKDCIIFRGKYADLSECPTCKKSRYIPGTSVSVRTFTYLPVGPRLVRLFGTSNTAHLMQSHHAIDNTLFDIHDSPSWSEAYSTGGTFGGDR